MENYELYHHGVKGQKWGVRRTRSELGYRSSGKAKATAKKLGTKVVTAAKKNITKRIKERQEKAYYNKLHNKKLSQMTDKELKDLTNRVRLEANLKDAKYESRVQNARKFYRTVAQQPMNSFGQEFGKRLAKQVIQLPNDDNNDGGGKKKKKNKDNSIEVTVE